MLARGYLQAEFSASWLNGVRKGLRTPLRKRSLDNAHLPPYTVSFKSKSYVRSVDLHAFLHQGPLAAAWVR